jgi:hypothetical protein
LLRSQCIGAVDPRLTGHEKALNRRRLDPARAAHREKRPLQQLRTALDLEDHRQLPTSMDCAEAWSAYFASDARRHMNPAEMGHLHGYAWPEDDEDPRGDGPMCIKRGDGEAVRTTTVLAAAWVLLTPPLVNGRFVFDAHSLWGVARTYQTSRDCNNAATEFTQQHRDELNATSRPLAAVCRSGGRGTAKVSQLGSPYARSAASNSSRGAPCGSFAWFSGNAYLALRSAPPRPGTGGELGTRARRVRVRKCVKAKRINPGDNKSLSGESSDHQAGSVF